MPGSVAVDQKQERKAGWTCAYQYDDEWVLFRLYGTKEEVTDKTFERLMYVSYEFNRKQFPSIKDCKEYLASPEPDIQFLRQEFLAVRASVESIKIKSDLEMEAAFYASDDDDD